MHRIFGIKENVEYTDRKGAYLIPFKGNLVGVIQTPKGYFFLGGGIDGDETDEEAIVRECLEEAGCEAVVGKQVCTAETYGTHPVIGWFHPIQTYYLGELSEQKQTPAETDHELVWITYSALKGRMFSEMQSWALEECWKARQ